MTIKLSNSMRYMLKVAPEDWRNIMPGPTTDALRRRGLVEYRDRPGEIGIMAGFQWRITETGREVDGRALPAGKEVSGA